MNSKGNAGGSEVTRSDANPNENGINSKKWGTTIRDQVNTTSLHAKKKKQHKKTNLGDDVQKLRQK